MNNNQTNIATALATATGTVQTLERHANNSCSNCCNISSSSSSSNCNSSSNSSSSSNTNNATYYYQRRLQHLLLLALLVCVASLNSCWLQPVQARRHAPLMFEEADTARRSNRPAASLRLCPLLTFHWELFALPSYKVLSFYDRLSNESRAAVSFIAAAAIIIIIISSSSSSSSSSNVIS
ncbi:hypothetical protein AWZ03_012368 [Drosophila navojoa]|uniref:Uncharacterized protein n=1 Tax=Drosophila navojoa TaxID=7232 RepID=A0A484B028_DRONA|nr:hypothetical protein AWZ03_012368 [Drosophila navojoa]